MEEKNQGFPDSKNGKNGNTDRMKVIAVITTAIAIASFSWMIRGEIANAQRQSLEEKFSFIIDNLYTRTNNHEQSILMLQASDSAINQTIAGLKERQTAIYNIVLEIKQDLKAHSP